MMGRHGNRHVACMSIVSMVKKLKEMMLVLSSLRCTDLSLGMTASIFRVSLLSLVKPTGLVRTNTPRSISP